VVGAFSRLEVRHQFVSDFETREADDADEFVAVLPDLTLLEL
jgi:hypothetical protein